MKLLSHVLLVLALSLVAKAALICPDGVNSECYPQTFEPSKNWQVIREGQQIPAGLHVRVNLETGEQEARLLLSEDTQEHSELVLVEQPEEKPEDLLPSRFRTKQALLAGDVNLLEYESAVHEVLQYTENSDTRKLESALDTLIELSHDIDYGVELASHPKVFRSMKEIAELQTANDNISEKIYRIMGASLRNNPEAVTHFVQNNESGLIPELYRMLSMGQASDLVQKRILGVIHALFMDSTYAATNLNTDNARYTEGLTSLIAVFPRMGDAAKERLMLILTDLSLFGADPGDSTIDANKAFSAFLQRLLHQQAMFLEPQFQTMFRSLAELHQSEDLPVSQDFLHWLSKQAEERKSAIRQRDQVYTDADADFDSFLTAARHFIFGNPNAARKTYDEL
ncbi:hypothetical protein METBIDRAFT_38338 [Metschnikowia bicuspidata var. bicuspidata NRRL YB-4993]|uniref:Nucleotide exchange factor SIL1 n=1 Tax=Metschnikowia bicuspidata var. bicuspidata NRRL YB-4993 TaxID=869754 RepID=A0A1A0HJY7_9ASCO|nr:hypothetical protein METBIDRAFT_38338 [Metschnikowia bicuspidata var. bicuspidata NRRL YB-4993]OBA24335.1 hypothetical protein METBIDRAFT_38338 [Metschnikowia bicuspidata var. bicuspidata NRRL YB-4993]